MTIEIIFLGTGNAFSKVYKNTNLLIQFHNTNLLVDCGVTCPSSLQDLGMDADAVDNIFISHLHSDHIGGLEEIALKNKYIYRRPLHLYIPESLKTSIWKHSLRGGLEYTVEGKVSLDYYFQVHPVKKTFQIQGLTFQMIPTYHIPGMKSYGLFFHTVFYTGDTIFDRNLLERMSSQADIIIHDCSFHPNPVHTSFEELLELPTEIRKKILLIHYEDRLEKQQEYIKKQGFQCAQKHGRLKIEF